MLENLLQEHIEEELKRKFVIDSLRQGISFLSVASTNIQGLYLSIDTCFFQEWLTKHSEPTMEQLIGFAQFSVDKQLETKLNCNNTFPQFQKPFAVDLIRKCIESLSVAIQSFHELGMYIDAQYFEEWLMENPEPLMEDLIEILLLNAEIELNEWEKKD